MEPRYYKKYFLYLGRTNLVNINSDAKNLILHWLNVLVLSSSLHNGLFQKIPPPPPMDDTGNPVINAR